MNKILLNLAFLTFSTLVFSQSTNSSNCLDGIWKGTEYIKEPFPDVTSSYVVFAGNKKLEFDLKHNEVSVFISGFQDYSSDVKGLSDLKFKKQNLKSKGLYYTHILDVDEKQEDSYFSIDINFTCNSVSLFLFYTDYEKIGKIDTKVRMFLKKKSIEMKRDLLKEFNIPPPDPKITITTSKSFFYQDASEAKPKKSFLLKGDIAFVEETKGDWLFIRFEGKTITRGWMHKKNIQYLK